MVLPIILLNNVSWISSYQWIDPICFFQCIVSEMIWTFSLMTPFHLRMLSHSCFFCVCFQAHTHAYTYTHTRTNIYTRSNREMGLTKERNLASSYCWWHLNRPKEETTAFECHIKGKGGTEYLGIPSFLWQQSCIKMGSYVRNLFFLSLSHAFVLSLCLNEAKRAVLLWCAHSPMLLGCYDSCRTRVMTP